VRKVLTALLLVSSLLWQGLASTHASSNLEDVAHALSHIGPAHHHEADGSTHFDDSDESLQHMQVDNVGSAGAAIPAAVSFVSLDLGQGHYRAPAESPPPDPFLAGLDRPPRRLS
jgi:hypothetical protein